MAAAYFTLPSLSRKKKEWEQPKLQKPVLPDKDAAFLEDKIETKQASQVASETAADDSAESEGDREVSNDKPEPAFGTDMQDVEPSQKATVPATTAQSEPKSLAPSKGKFKQEDFPSQEEAEAATRNWDAVYDHEKAQPDQKTWISFLASYAPKVGRSGTATPAASAEPQTETKETPSDQHSKEAGSPSQQRSWAQYATSVLPSTVPSMSALRSLPTWKKTLGAENIGTEDTSKTDEGQEREVSNLLDKLNMSTINNHVFALSAETQKLYEQFAQILKDTINGVPTAYQDMDKFLKEAGPTLDKQFKALPPFVQTLIKTLPAKLGTTLGPELLAATSEKPGADLKKRMAMRGESGSATPGSSAAGKKKKRRIPTIKSLLSKEGAVAGILRSIVNFLTTRFPFLASATNVLMSLAVFVLMFVFWYCHKRGKEARLAQAADADLKAGEDAAQDDDDGDDDEVDVEDTDDDTPESESAETETSEEKSPGTSTNASNLESLKTTSTTDAAKQS